MMEKLPSPPPPSGYRPRYTTPNPFTDEIERYNIREAWRAYHRSNACFDYMIDNKAIRVPVHMINAYY